MYYRSNCGACRVGVDIGACKPVLHLVFERLGALRGRTLLHSSDPTQNICPASQNKVLQWLRNKIKIANITIKVAWHLFCRRGSLLGRSGDNVSLCAANLKLCFPRSEEHTSELQSLMRISYAV